MNTENTGMADMQLYRDFDQNFGAAEYADPIAYSKDAAMYQYAMPSDVYTQQQALFTQHRVDAAKFTTMNNFQTGISVMEDHGQTNVDYEIEWFLHDDGVDPLQPQIDDAKNKAQEFMQIVKSKYPNRYFILKRVTDSTDFWQICALDKHYIIITDESYAKKLQNCYEVIIYKPTFLFSMVDLLNRFLTTCS